MGALHEGHLALVRRAQRRQPPLHRHALRQPDPVRPERRSGRLSARRGRRSRQAGERSASISSSRPTSPRCTPPGFATTVTVARLTDHLCGPLPARPFRRRRHRRHQAAAAIAARCRLFRREGFPAAAGHPPAGARSRHPRADRRRADRARRRRPRPVVAQRLSVAERACCRAGPAAHAQRHRRAIGAVAEGRGAADRVGPRSAERGRLHQDRLCRGVRCGDPAADRRSEGDPRASSPPPGWAAPD